MRNAENKKATHCVFGTVTLCVIVCLLLYPGNNRTVRAYSGQAPQPKAAIIDHLSLTFPSAAFVQTSTAILRDAGYAVDYYEGKKVTVEMFRELPTYGYNLIILRAHSAFVEKERTLTIFTAEPYSKHKYVYDQLRHRIARGRLENPAKDDPGCLAITDKFVRFSMKGSFDGALVINMGCTGIRGGASAFLEKGARAYVGWDGKVSASHTDRAVVQLLKRLLVKRQTIGDAVAQTMKEVGQEPEYKNLLLFWPLSAAGLRVAPPNNE